jgi:hypothetical protein
MADLGERELARDGDGLRERGTTRAVMPSIAAAVGSR